MMSRMTDAVINMDVRKSVINRLWEETDLLTDEIRETHVLLCMLVYVHITTRVQHNALFTGEIIG